MDHFIRKNITKHLKTHENIRTTSVENILKKKQPAVMSLASTKSAYNSTAVTGDSTIHTIKHKS